MASLRHYNLVLLVPDDLRADHVSAYGYHRRTTPELDRRARAGTVFKNCMSTTGWTLTACASILTGQPPDVHGLIDHNQHFHAPKLGHYLEGTHHRIAFTNNGNTIPDSVSEGYLGTLGHLRRPAKWKFFGWDDGFDEFEWTGRQDHQRPFTLAKEFLRGYRGEKPYFLFFHSNLVHDYHMDRDYYLDGVKEWIGDDVHPALRRFGDGPRVWNERPEGLAWPQMKREMIAKYDAGIRTMDQRFNEILDLIDFDNTIVIFMSDHGEGFEPEVGRVHHCGRLHQDLLHVPLIVWLPPGLRKQYSLGAVEERYCSTIDVVPTVLTWLGIVEGGFAGRLLFDLSAHRSIQGVDRGYVYWGEDCRRESYDTCRIEIRSTLTYPLKSIEVRKNDAVRRYDYNLAYDPGERENLASRPSELLPELEPVTFVVAVNDWEEAEVNLLDSPVRRSPRHEWILVDNTDNRAYSSISKLYQEAAEDAQHDLVFFMHQDLYLPPGWERRVGQALSKLQREDPQWGVIGAVGAIKALENPDHEKELKGHWCDPHGYHRVLPLPHEVESLDEQWLGFRRSSGLSFDADLPGFHCYGIDLSLSARKAGLKSYAIDAFVWHKYRDRRARLISCSEDSTKIQGRWSENFMSQFNPAAEYVAKKWSEYLPFQTTSWTWK